MKLLLVLLILHNITFQLSAREPQKLDRPAKADEPEKADKPREPSQPKQIELLNALSMEFDKRIGDDARRVIGMVLFKHEDAYMHCDSAYLYSLDNSLKAFSNIHIQVGDTIDIHGDKLYYDGNTSIAELHGNVKMQDKNMVLTTDHLIYDLKANTANYYDGGRIIDHDNVLTSKWGFYYADTKHFFFKDDVKLVNPEYTMDSDTLKYNTLTEIAHFFGPTTIISEENIIFCKNGWYDTKNDIAQFSREAFINNNEHSITGDSLFYDRNKGYGRALMNVMVIDTVQDLIINGHFGEHFEKKGLSVVTQEAMLTIISEKDSLFLHADTLKYFLQDETGNHDSVIAGKNDLLHNKKELNEKGYMQESEKENKEIKKLLAYNRAKFYRTDLQGMSDSLVYNFSDSVIHMYHNPILWSEEHQLTAKKIEIETWNNTVNKAHLIDAAFIISEEDTAKFNQVKGRKITGHFNENQLYKVDVFGNSETIYYVRNDDGDLIGINKAISTNMTIFVDNNQVNHIIFFENPEADLFPPEDLAPEERLLRHFKWHINLRPKSKKDIFTWK